MRARESGQHDLLKTNLTRQNKSPSVADTGFFFFFFFCRIPVELENRRSSQGGGGRTPCTLPLDPPLSSPSASFSPYCFLALFLRAALHYPNAWNRLFTRRRQWEELAIFIRLSPKPLDP